ncbi:unnamed protein product [Medioppia subpectinata]|uniref:Uncharacterized protein n=1 Tax=Medioppia subpectinata TaxID=1979941 RepID=A0A7R9Q7M9_9ACAR|nr:unnamed protein product [Medioppia subpectinata]CAG2114973.1 unnamed protein product [Medioppia subpectinata]
MFTSSDNSGVSDNTDNNSAHKHKSYYKDKSALNLSLNLDKMERVLKGKAAIAHKKFSDFKEKVRVEALEMEINRCDDNKRLKQVLGGWALSSSQMRYLSTKPYVYNASAGSYLELLFLQTMDLVITIHPDMDESVHYHSDRSGHKHNYITHCNILFT